MTQRPDRDTDPIRASQRPTPADGLDPEDTLTSPPSSALRLAPLPVWLRDDATGEEHLSHYTTA